MAVANFNQDWGYLTPAPSFMRSMRVVMVATAVGATAGAGTVFALMDRPPVAETQRTASLVAGGAAAVKILTPGPAAAAIPANDSPVLETSVATAAWNELNAAPRVPAPIQKSAPNNETGAVAAAPAPAAAATAPVDSASTVPTVLAATSTEIAGETGEAAGTPAAAPESPAAAESARSEQAASAVEKKKVKKKPKVARSKARTDYYSRWGYNDWQPRHAGYGYYNGYR